MIKELTNSDTGQYRVRTGTGSYYLLDLDARTLTRLKAEAPMAPDCAGEAPVELRRDGEQLELHGVLVCRLGERALFVVQIRDEPSMVTLRDTSQVQKIVGLAGPTDGL